eukprot:m.215995 g.215995  ORF g.215995 m.215995 type:complete len:296 (-) comp28126_c0_seq1:112-999(-)
MSFPRPWPVVVVLAVVLTAVSAQMAGIPAYLPSRQAVVCACPKCGSTAFMNWLYEGTHNGTRWPHKGPPWIQDLGSSRWDGLFTPLSKLPTNDRDAVLKDPNVVKVAIVRDPVERLLSAWRSKVKCEASGKHGADVHDRDKLTLSMLRLLSNDGVFKSHIEGQQHRRVNFSRATKRECLYLNEYVDVLAEIHHLGRAAQLNEHFRPQQFLCFKWIPVQKWTSVVSLASNTSKHKGLHLLASRMDTHGTHHHAHSTHPEHSHRTHGVATDELETMYPESMALLASLVHTERKLITL